VTNLASIRRGVNWGNGGRWNDATRDEYPDSVEIDYSGPKTIDRVVVSKDGLQRMDGARIGAQ
jgi:hypothetical protein